MSSRIETSAGGVVYRKKKDAIEVLICKHSGYHKWVLPKGLIEKGEKPEETAIREVEEETGIRGRVVQEIGEPESYVYTFNGLKVFKKVHYYLMEYDRGSTKSHDFEMEEVEWMDIDEAIARMGFDGAKNVLRRAKELLTTL